MSYIKKVKCSFCGGKLIKVIHLGKIPPVNSFYSFEKSVKVEKFPLTLAVCERCELLQLSTILEPEQLFLDYHYLTSASGSLVKDLEELAEYCIQSFNLSKKSKVLDIGSNDGTFLRNFLGKVQAVLGVDPGEEAGSIAKQNGVESEVRFFDLKNAKFILKKYGQFDLVSSLHNFANIPDINDFLEGIKLILSSLGVLIIEVADAEKMIEQGRFDSIYHEHYNYFSSSVLKRILAAHGFKVFKVVRNLKQGGSLRVFANHAQNTRRVSYSEVSLEKYDEYAQKVLRVKLGLLKSISGLKGVVAGFGAPAKAVVLANMLKLGKKQVLFIVDSTEFKQSKMLPGTDIPIFSEVYLKENQVESIIIFAWSYTEEIFKRLKKFSPVRVLIPFPEVRIVDL